MSLEASPYFASFLYTHIHSINKGDLWDCMTGTRLMLFWGTCAHLFNTSALSNQQKANKYSNLIHCMYLGTHTTFICVFARYSSMHLPDILHVLLSALPSQYKVVFCLHRMLLFIISSFVLTEA